MERSSTANLMLYGKGKLWVFLFILMFSMGFGYAQTTLISPTGDGGFENGATFAANGWTEVNDATNTWNVGTVPGWFTGTGGAYISNNSGANWEYTNSGVQRSHFYRDVTFPAGPIQVLLSFDWRANGNDGNWDNLQVYIADVSITPSNAGPTGTNTTSTGWTGYTNGTTGYYLTRVNGTSVPTTTSTVNYSFTTAQANYVAGQTKRLIFTWKNDGSGGTNPPASVDNISLTAFSCFPPTALTSGSISPNGAIIGWTAPTDGTPSGYEWKVVLDGAGVNGTAQASGTTTAPTVSANVSGLTPNTAYQFYVRSECGAGNYSQWSSVASFTTACVVFDTFPFNETFETASPTRSCWTNIHVAGSTNWTYASGSSATIGSAQEGSLNARFVSQNGSGTPITKLVSPFFDLSSLTNPRVVFYLGQPIWGSDQNETKVYYRVSSTDPWVEIAHYTQDISQWTEFVLQLPNPSSTYQIAFEGINNWGRANVIDNVTIEESPTCYPPTALTVTNIGGTTADLNFTEPTQGVPANYIWKVVAAGAGANGTAVATGTVAAPATGIPLSGLSITTSYDVYIRSECGGGDTSAWSALANFKTIQNPVTVFPYVADFEAGLDEWQTNNGAQTNKWEVGSAVSGSGSQSLYISNDAGVSNAYTITSASVVHAYRDFQFPAGFPLIQLAFKWQSMGDGDVDRMRVYVAPTSFTPTAGSQITASGSAPTGIVQLGGNFSNQGTFTTANYTLPFSYEDHLVRLIFEWRNNASGGTQPPAAIDSIQFILGTCASPVSLGATPAITDATLTWNEVGGATDWNIEYGPAGFTPGTGTVAGASGTPTYTISSGLSPETSYSFYVQSDCGSSQSPWTGPFTFQTLCQPYDITGTTPDTRCGVGTVTLGATSDPAAVLTWYDVPSGGTSLGTGSSFVTPTISATDTFYVDASTVGVGNTSFGSGASTGTDAPYNITNGGYGGMKGQYLFTAAELIAAGVMPGNITGFSFELTTAGATLDSFAVQMGTTTLSEFPSTISILGGLTTVRPYASFVPAVGVNTITFDTPFAWDGTSNIVISTSWSNRNSSNPSSTIRYDALTSNRSQSLRRDGQSAAFMFNSVGVSSLGSSLRSVNRPKITFVSNRITCVSARTSVIATVTTPPSVTISNDTAVCIGNSAVIGVTSANPDYTYVWNPGNLTNAQETVSPSSTTTYIVTATDTSGGPNDGCIAVDSVVVTVNPLPPAPTMDPAAGDLCLGDSQVLTTSLSSPYNLFFENFEGTVNMTTVNTSTGTNPTAAAWTVRPDGYQNTGGTTVFTFHSPDNSNFILTNSDAVGSGANVITDLISPAINTSGYTGLTLSFKHFFKFLSTSAGTVSVSTDGGTSWTPVQTYSGADVGTSTAFANASINLDSYVDYTDLRIRFRYTAAWHWFWALDDISLDATLPTLLTSWTASPTSGAGLPAGADTLSASHTDITVTPTAPGTYTYTATIATPHGCTTADTSTITVNDLPTVDAGASQEVCPGTSITLSGSGATSYTWDNGVSDSVAFNAPNATTLYTVTGTDGNGCQNTDTVTVFILPATPVNITPAGPIVTCQNQPVVLTANGPAPGPAQTITQWNFNSSNLVPNVGSGTALLIGGTTEAFVSGAGSTDPVQPGNAWNTTTYPAQGQASGTAGVQYNVSTAGYTNINFSFDIRHSGTAANTYLVEYNPDVTNPFAPWLPVETMVFTTFNAFSSRSIDLSSVPAASDNPNFGLRIVSAFDTINGSNYVNINTSQSYGPGGTVRYDMVTFSGQPLTATYSWSPVPSSSQTFTPIETGTYTVTVTEPGVCPGVDSVEVTVHLVVTTPLTAVICADESYTLVNGDIVNTTGVYSRTATSVVTGCDSIVVVNLTVNPVYNITAPAVTICSNESYTLADGTTVTTADTYVTTVNTINGCDSTVTVTVNVIPAQEANVAASICTGDSYLLPDGSTVTSDGVYTSTFTAANGCDSTIVTTLTVLPSFASTQNPVICDGDSHTMPDGSTETVAGTYTFPYTAANGCDSTITVNLTVNPVYTTNLSVELCPGDTYTLVDGTVVSSAGSFPAVTNTINGCDSTVVVDVTLRDDYNTSVSASICQGETYTLVNGNQVTTGGTYVAATQTIYGCDSVVTLTLTVNPVYNETASASICQGETYELPDGQTVSASGVYTTTVAGAQGCDSTIVTTLTVNPLPNVNLGSNIAVLNPPVTLNAGAGFASYNWSTGAQTQTITVTQNGTYSVTVTNQFGCEASDEVQVNFLASVVDLGTNGGSISLFPNPTSDRFTINVYGYSGGDLRLDLINAIGQVVRTEMIGNANETFSKEMDVASLAAGTYTLRVKGNNADASLRLVIVR